MTRRTGETWVFESLVGAVPGLTLSPWRAVAIQVALFETAVLALGWYYGLGDAMVAGTVAVAVAGVGSLAMLHLAAGYRRLDAPPAHGRLLFGSSIEVALGVLAFVALVVHLFVVDPRSGSPFVGRLFGPEPPILAVYLALVVLWDLCYRIGTSWWAAVVSLWRALRVDLDADERALARRLDATNTGFAATQLALVPFLLDAPVLLAAVLGHVVAVVAVTVAATLIDARS